MNLKISLVAFSVLLSACESVEKRVDIELQQRSELAHELLNKGHETKRFKYFVEKSSTPWIGDFKFGEKKKKRPLQLDKVLFIEPSYPMDLEVAVYAVSKISKIHIAMDTSALVHLGLAENINNNAEEDSEGAEKIDSLDKKEKGKSKAEILKDLQAIRDKLNGSKQLTKNNLSEKILLRIPDRTLEWWLDEFTYQRGLYWEWDYLNNKPYITITATKSISIAAESVINTVKEGDIEFASSNSWNDLKVAVDSMLSNVGTAKFSGSSGQILLNDRPENLAKIKDFIEYENKIYSRQVNIIVTIRTYKRTENKVNDSDWNLLFSNLGRSISLSTGSTTSTDGFDLGAEISNGGKFNGSKAALTAIHSTLQSDINKTFKLEFRNRTKFKLKPIVDEKIVASTSVSENSDGEDSETQNIESVETGADIIVSPVITSKNRIAIDFSLSSTDELSRESRETSGGDITLPTTSTINEGGHLILEDGETKILVSSSTEKSREKSGIDQRMGWINYFLGGSSKIQDEETITLVTVTAKIIGDK